MNAEKRKKIRKEERVLPKLNDKRQDDFLETVNALL